MGANINIDSGIMPSVIVSHSFHMFVHSSRVGTAGKLADLEIGNGGGSVWSAEIVVICVEG